MLDIQIDSFTKPNDPVKQRDAFLTLTPNTPGMSIEVCKAGTLDHKAYIAISDERLTVWANGKKQFEYIWR